MGKYSISTAALLLCVQSICLAAKDADAGINEISRSEAAMAWIDSLGKPPIVYVWQVEKSVKRPENPTVEQRYNAIVALDLGGEDIVDDDLHHLVGMPKLERLSLNYTTISDKGLATICRIPTITHLNLSYSKVTWRSYRQLKNLPNLTHLYLRGMWDVYKGWDVLKQMKGLQHLDMRGCKLAASAFNSLQQALPKCVILPDGDSG